MNDRDVVLFWKHIQMGDGCWLWTARRDKYGYGLVKRNNPALNTKAHRRSWEIHFGPIPAGLSVMHRCDNPPCVRPDHLALGTQADNNHDAASKFRYRQAEAHAHAKLTNAQVIEAREKASRGQETATLAAQYGVTTRTMHKLLTGQTWKSLLPENRPVRSEVKP